jgi:hypothetical protein
MNEFDFIYKQQRELLFPHLAEVLKNDRVLFCFTEVEARFAEYGIRKEHLVMKTRKQPLPEAKQALSYLLAKVCPKLHYKLIAQIIYPTSDDHSTIVHNLAEFILRKQSCPNTEAWYNHVIEKCPFKLSTGDPVVKHRVRLPRGVHIFYNALGRPYSNNEIPRAFEKFQTLGTNFIHNKRKDSKLF